MYQFLFKNKWAALAFVVLTLSSVQLLVGGSEDDNMITRTQDRLIPNRNAQNDEAGEFATDRPARPEIFNPDQPSNREAAAVGFTPDEELIDTANGFDPTPENEASFFDEASDDAAGADNADEDSGY